MGVVTAGGCIANGRVTRDIYDASCLGRHAKMEKYNLHSFKLYHDALSTCLLFITNVQHIFPQNKLYLSFFGGKICYLYNKLL